MTPTDRLHADHFLAPLDFATFEWDLATDAMVWGEAAANLLQGLPAEALGHGAALAKLMEPTQTVRADAIIEAAGQPSYQVEYGLRAKASDPLLWLEESGRIILSADGKPVRIEGVVRVINERHARDEQLLKLSLSHAGARKEACHQRSAEELAKLAPNMRAPSVCPRELGNSVHAAYTRSCSYA